MLSLSPFCLLVSDASGHVTFSLDGQTIPLCNTALIFCLSLSERERGTRRQPALQNGSDLVVMAIYHNMV